MSGKLTQKAIKKALLELLEEKPFSKITVHDITDRIEVNRQTFYYHYRDIFDLLGSIFDDIIEQSLSENAGLSDNLTSLYDEMIKIRPAVINLVKSDGYEELRTRLEPRLKQLFSHTADTVCPAEKLNRADKDLLVSYHAELIETFFTRWVRNGMNENSPLFKRFAHMAEANFKSTAKFLAGADSDR